VTNEVVLNLHGLKIPHLHDLIITAGNHAELILGGNEADAADPIVVVTLLKSVLAFTNGVPELDGTITTTGEDEAVIRTEASGENILLMTKEGLLALTAQNVPETNSVIPGSSQSILTISSKGNFLNNVRVTFEGAGRNTHGHNLGGILNNLTRLDLPDEASLITRGGDNGVLIFRRSSDGGDPSVVAKEASTKNKLSRHSLKGISSQIQP
jgi:hypothetical protein